MTHTHSTHPDIINRLKRANGHVSKVVDMIKEGKPCVEVAQQMQAICRALSNAKSVFVQDHIEGCIEASGKETPAEIQKKMIELKEITKYL
jgi:DNA-binding FrmR family transcriptional regulator